MQKPVLRTGFISGWAFFSCPQLVTIFGIAGFPTGFRRGFVEICFSQFHRFHVLLKFYVSTGFVRLLRFWISTEPSKMIRLLSFPQILEGFTWKYSCISGSLFAFLLCENAKSDLTTLCLCEYFARTGATKTNLGYITSTEHSFVGIYWSNIVAEEHVCNRTFVCHVKISRSKEFHITWKELRV